MTDYTEYEMNRREVVTSVLGGSAMLFVALYLFYHSVLLSLIGALAGAAAPRWRRGFLLRRRRERLKMQFKELLFSLTSSLAAGRSAENAFRAAWEDLSLLYTEPNADILRELRVIGHLLDQSIPLDEAVRDFARRAGIDEITMFGDTLNACKRSGGDLLEVMRRTSSMIGEKMSVDGEIAVLLAQKRFEARIMMAVPFVFLGFLGWAAPDYMAPLYSGFGYVLLTIALLLLGGCFWLIHRIMSIEM
ncbi:type II secretion system F family protein [Paenibacillus agaridevorans]|uniref:type II secretion system F family protein n=1 Tax=Paenibacillus agaridevorans TaxID=171404 RepID=UPI001BE4726E|nr:type II secretion system F family protein [Paenibacillus agaridevorans]